jgi:hypothetical protein
VASIATTFASPTLSPTLYHLPFISAALPNMPITALTGCCLGGGGANRFFFFSPSATDFDSAKCTSISSPFNSPRLSAILTIRSALAEVERKLVTFTKTITARSTDTPTSTTGTNSLLSSGLPSVMILPTFLSSASTQQ